MRIHVKTSHPEPVEFDIAEVNAMLARGQLSGEELAWRPGLEQWVTLREIDGIRLAGPPPMPGSDRTWGNNSAPAQSDYGLAQVENPAVVDPDFVDQSKSFFGGATHPWRRFLARLVELSTSGLLLIGVLGFMAGALFPDRAEEIIAPLENVFVAGIVMYILWIPCEALLLSTVGTTPAKWLFGIRVLHTSGARLSFGAALKRTVLVFVQGEGLGLPIVTLVTRICAYNRLTKTGTTLWDTSTGAVVTHRPWGWFRATCCVVLVVAVVAFIAASNAMPPE